MAALAPANNISADKKRVKVYELKNNDWYDRGTGFCEGKLLSGANAPAEELDARVVVTSEEEPERVLLETRIAKDDGYQKQQETLIVWTESNGVDMALSFQEADGCAQIWQFVSEIQGRLLPEDGLSDDLLGPEHTVSLPEPTIGKLEEVVDAIRQIASTPAGRDALSKYIMSPDQMYILKLAPVLKELEDREEVQELHRLCTIMKHIILLNDTSIIEFIVTDQAIMGVVGALEYDPDFPSHRANHRQFLSDKSKFKEVVKFDHPEVTKKIHYTYRLLYLKDVVLARILDDPTFSVLNSLIFFHQVDIINHLQGNRAFLHDLFAIFTNEDEVPERKKQACLFIQNCCAVSKTIQAPARAQLYGNFLHHGLFNTITYALRHHDAAVRVAGTDVLVSLIDHDAHVVRNHIIKALQEQTVPLTDILIELLLVEVDLGVKSQMADAIKILLDPTSTQAGIDAMNRAGNSEMMAKRGGPGDHPGHRFSPQANSFIQNFYEVGAKRLFKPLKDLEGRESMRNLTVQETSLYTHLVEVLSFFVRQHAYQCKLFILSENLHSRIAQLLECPQKHMKLIALKWFRTCIGLQDEFHNRQLTNNKLFEPILNIVYETMPRDNLLNSCCLELFEYIKREGIKQIIYHLVETYRDRLMNITYVNTFQGIVHKFDQYNNPFVAEREGDTSFTTEPDTPDALRGRMINGRQPFSGLKEDADEDAYFNADDDLDGEFGEDDGDLPSHAQMAKIDAVMSNGHASASSNASPMKALVNYPDDDDDEEGMDLLASSPDTLKDQRSSSSTTVSDHNASTDSPDGQRGRSREPRIPDSPPEPIAVKRRRAEVDDDDELGKMMGGSKRRNSSASLNSAKSGLAAVQLDGASDVSDAESPMSIATDKHGPEDLALASPKSQPMSSVAGGHTQGPKLRRKGSLKVKNEGATNPGRYAIKPIDIANGRRGESDGKKSNGGAVG